MKKKVFSLMMTLVLAFMGVARADVVTVGSGTDVSTYVPAYNYYYYGLTQQIYTAAEIGYVGTINSIAFYNAGAEKTRTWDVYMVQTTKTEFASNTDWIPVTSSDLVFSGSVTMTAGAWTALTLSTPFDFDGTSNLAIVVDDNTGSWTPSPHMTCRVFNGTNCAMYVYSDGTNYNPMAPVAGNVRSEKNLLQLDMNVTGSIGGGGGYVDNLHVKYMDGTTEVIDQLDLGVRPIGAWMAPFDFVMFSGGPDYTVNVLDFTPSDGIFTVGGEELPFQVTPSADVDLNITTNGTQAGVIERQFLAITEGDRAGHIWPIRVEFYEPEIPDVVEKPCAQVPSTVPFATAFVERPSVAHGTTLHNDYTLPFPEIPEGYDAVYKLVFANDVMLNAEVTDGADGKVALYLQEGSELPHPMADNNYTGLTAGGASGATPFEAQIGDGTSTTGYFPFYTLYNYSIAENLFLATELEAAGVTTAPMTSLSWYATNAPGYAQQGITIWMANVTDDALTTTSHVTTGMTKVYTGTMTPAIGWNEFVFNEGNFAWDGSSNVLIFCQRNNGDWNSTVNWQATTGMPFNCMAYRYQDSGAYDVTTTNPMYTSTIRPNIIMKAATGGSKSMRASTMSYGPVITDAALPKGTYYLVASSTDADFEVTIDGAVMPCPDVEGYAFNPIPADDADDLDPTSVTLEWSVPNYATEWRLVFGSTYYPEEGHPATIITDWSRDMANSYTVRNLFSNTNYFWHVEFRNDGCPAGKSSPIWGFTTHLRIPQNLTVEDETVFNDETVQLSWTAVVDRTYRWYYIYRNFAEPSNSATVFEKIGETQLNNMSATTFTDGPLAYNMGGYTYYVTAVYDEGESDASNMVNVKVSGYGDVNGHVYEQDGTTGIANATVTMVGEDEFGDPHTYEFTTDANGYYTGHIYAGVYDGSAACQGYQPIDAPITGNPITITYNNTTTPVDYKLDENFYGPCAVVAEYYPDSLDPSSPYVKVYWGCGLPTGGIVEDFETGDFSKVDWQLDSNNPWSITTTNPYEGTYCMKSGGAGVANVVSNMTVTVNIPADGQMSFYGKISCENNYDHGYFYIDGVQKGSYTGAGTWGERVFDITAGEHIFQWRYTKDSSVNSNDDCFYVDYISFLRQPDAVAATANNVENSNEQGYSLDNRALSHYRVYRTNCYQDSPYTEENTVLLATVWVPDTVYMDVEWADLPAGVYKWGVGAVYVGNRGEEVESPIAWTEPVNVNPDKANRDGSFDFEDGLIPAGWTNDATYPWTVVTDAMDHAGHCIKSGNSGIASSTSSISATVNYASAGTVSFLGGFWGEGSSDSYDWDKCRFYIDDNIMIDYGAHAAWESVSFPVTAGNHTFTWTYKKDGSVNPTGDAFFVDNVVFSTSGGSGGGGGGDGTYAAGTEPIQEARESVIVWSNCLDKDMYLLDLVDVNVLLNSADSPEGAEVSLTNLNEIEQDLYAMDPVTLDESGFYAWDSFRKGEYAIEIEKEGYETIYDTVSIWDETHLRYVMTEILYGVTNVYVSRTGWAMWDGIDIPSGGGGGGGGGGGTGTSFTEDFESGIPATWTLIDADGDGNDWYDLVGNNPNNIPGHNGSEGFATSASYNGSVLYPDNYLVTPQVTLGGTFSFWACAQDASYAAEVFGVAVSTAGNTNASDFTMVNQWTLTAKGVGAQTAETRSGNRVQGQWYQYSVDLSAYAGQTGYIAIRHFGCHDMFRINVDDVELSNGSKSDDRHLEYYKVMCTSIDGVPIFNHNTVHPFCQLSTDEPFNAPLVEGEHYLCKVAVMYSTGLSEWSDPVEWQYEPCDHWGPVDEVEVNTSSQGNHIEWVFEHGHNQWGGEGAKGFEYSPMSSGMLSNGTYVFNITDIANYDERVYFLYNLSKDARFDVVNGEAAGMFIISAAAGYEDMDLEGAFHDFSYNNAIEFGRMDKVQAADVANAYKSAMPASFTNSLMMDIYIHSRENNMCEFADPFCTDNGMYEFPAGVNAGSGETGPEYDCLYTQPNPAWYYMRIGDAGGMDIHMYSTPEVDIDFCCWGPFEDPTTPCPYGLTDDKVVSCSYSTSWTEHCIIPNTAQTGEYYILVITNYSNQTCNINFSMVSGNGSTDCGILPPVDIIGFMITQDGEYLAFVGPTEREYTDIDEFGDHEYCVRVVYPGPQELPTNNYYFSMSCPVCEYTGGGISCEPGEPIHAAAIGATDQVKIWWGEENPGPGPGECDGDEFTLNFDDGVMPAGWTTNDADGDGYGWILGSACDGIYLDGGNLSGAGHNASQDLIVSGSYSNVVGPLTPDNWLISPAVTLCEGSVFSFWACGQDANYVAEHFGVAVSEDGGNTFTMVQEWTMTAKEAGNGVMSVGRGGNTRAQGSWHQYTVDLSDYAGEGRKIAIRHFNCTDMFILDIDDIQLTSGAKNRSSIASYKVYRSDAADGEYQEIGQVAAVAGQTYYEYIDTPEAPGMYFYQVKAVYDNGCVSGPALSFDNPVQNYVQAEVTGMGENSDKVAIYPNPTNGNVTIEAAGMSRITVVSVLGQVVFDTEVTADSYTLNMSQFNAGMYMVRVNTESGVTVKRVTVMQ